MAARIAARSEHLILASVCMRPADRNAIARFGGFAFWIISRSVGQG
jgi:hypothetical protein